MNEQAKRLRRAALLAGNDGATTCSPPFDEFKWRDELNNAADTIEAMTHPKRIYLQAELGVIDDESTWCSDRINDDDEEYVRLSDLTSGSVVEVDGVRYRLIRADPLPDQDITDDPPALF